jgi:DNA-directed RNA polymerase specialized sigma24 family protein
MNIAEVTELAAADSHTRDTLVDELYGHGPMLLRRTGDHLDNEEAQDLVQTTFEIALRRLDGLREPRALRAWLSRSRPARHSGSCAACDGW